MKERHRANIEKVFKMKKLAIVLLLILILSGCAPKKDNSKLTVAVSIEPQKTFVEKVSGDKAQKLLPLMRVTFTFQSVFPRRIKESFRT